MLIPDSFVFDAFASTSLLPLGACSTELMPVAVPNLFLSRYDHLDPDDCNELGIEIVTVGMSQFGEAARTKGNVSFDDTVCIIVACARGGTVVTDDPLVSERCDAENVATITGSLLLVRLLESGFIELEEATIAHDALGSDEPLSEFAASLFESRSS